MSELRDAFSEVERLLEREIATTRGGSSKPGAALSGRERAKAIRETVDAFMRTTRWTIVVPGDRTSDLSNQELFEVLGGQGRDFLTDSVQLKQAVSKEMRFAFAGFPHVPTVTELRAEHTKQVKLFIANQRFAKGGGDLILTPLTPRYAAEKRAAGYGARPIGVRTGKLIAAFRRSAVLVYAR